MVGRAVVHDHVGDDTQPAGMGRVEERLEVVERAAVGMNAGVVGHVVAVVEQGRRVHRLHPDAIDP